MLTLKGGGGGDEPHWTIDDDSTVLERLVFGIDGKTGKVSQPLWELDHPVCGVFAEF